MLYFGEQHRHNTEKKAMDEIIKINTIDQYNEMFGFETLHPLVNIVEFDGSVNMPKHFIINYGFYAIFLKDTKGCKITYGRQEYDYDEGTVTSFAPGQVVESQISDSVVPRATGLLFHPDLIKGTPLGKEIRNYSFFSYSSNEALHLSDEERGIFVDCLNKIKTELNQPIDQFSRKLISKNIELLLDYCMRFYSRQFFTREVNNRNVTVRFEQLLDDYFREGHPRTEGLPSVKYFADKVCLSPNYFGDLIKKETGKTAQDYIHTKIIDLAKEMLLGTEDTVNQISYDLGFQYSQHFNRLFKKSTGFTPSAYRKVRQ